MRIAADLQRGRPRRRSADRRWRHQRRRHRARRRRRGLKCSVEQGDLAGGTSSASTKLIHGGLRYLEFFEFRLVREALIERERLLRIAPHIIWPMRFVLPHVPRACGRVADPARPVPLRPSGGAQAAARRRRRMDLRPDPSGAPLKPASPRLSPIPTAGSRTPPGGAERARRAQRGAEIRTRTRSARRGGRTAAVRRSARPRRAGEQVRGARPGQCRRPLGGFLRAGPTGRAPESVRLVNGSHIVVPRLFEREHAYILQNTDGRIVFAIPYQGRFTLVGTTDVPI